MDAQSQSAIKFLNAIIEVEKTLGKFAADLRGQPNVRTAVVWPFSPRENCFGGYADDGSFISYCGGDFGVSAELQSGYVVDWWLELSWNENNWRLEYNVFSNKSEGDGSAVAIAFAEFNTTSLTALLEQLTEAVATLIATGNDEVLFY